MGSLTSDILNETNDLRRFAVRFSEFDLFPLVLLRVEEPCVIQVSSYRRKLNSWQQGSHVTYCGILDHKSHQKG